MKDYISNVAIKNSILPRLQLNKPITCPPLLVLLTLLTSLVFSSTGHAAKVQAVDDPSITTFVNEQIIINVLSNDSATDDEGRSVPITSICLASDEYSDCHQAELQEVELLTMPTNGTIYRGQEQNTVTYVPNEGFIGTDSFVYAAFLDGNARDQASVADTAKVTIRVRAIPEPTKEEQQLIDAFNGYCSALEEESYASPSDVNTPPPSSVCSEYNNLSESQKLAARMTLRGDQISAQSSTTVNMARDQNSNIGSRLSQLRNNSSGVSVRGLTIKTESGKLDGTWLHAIYDSMTQGDIEPFQTGGSAGSEPSNSTYSPFGYFINGSISVGDKDSSATERGYDLDSDNFTFGLDYRYNEKFVFGAAYGLGSNEIKFNSSGDGMENTINNLFLYGSWFEDNFYLSTTLGYAFGELDTDRRIIVGSLNQVAKGSTDTSQILLQVNGSYDLSYGALSFGPYVNLDIIEGDIDGYTETNGGGFEIAFSKQDISSQLLTVGAQTQYALSYSWGILLPSLRMELKNEFNDSGDAIQGRFALDPTNTAFSISANKIDSFWMLFGAGVSAVFPHGLSAYVDLETNEGLGDLNLYTYSFGGRWELAF